MPHVETQRQLVSVSFGLGTVQSASVNERPIISLSVDGVERNKEMNDFTNGCPCALYADHAVGLSVRTFWTSVTFSPRFLRACVDLSARIQFLSLFFANLSVR